MTKIWITWEKHRRTSELVAALDGVKLFQLELEAPRLFRYPCLLFQTLFTLINERPNLTIVQNPSIVLSFFMVTLGKLLTAHILIDAHNGGLRPFYSKHNWLLPVYRMIQKQADLTIVTNEALSKEVRSNGGRPFVLQDKVPQLEESNHISLKGSHNVVLICTFEKDEPYREVIRAAGMIDSSICIYITGRYEKATNDITDQPPSNVIFTGFLSEQQYVNLLYSCDVIMDLTMLEHCLVCGAYEAVALGKPVVLSNTAALRNYFSLGAVYTENRAEAIAAAIDYALKNKTKLREEIVILRNYLRTEWRQKFGELVSILDRLAAQTK